MPGRIRSIPVGRGERGTHVVGANRHRVALLSSASPSANPASKGKRTTAVMPEHASRRFAAALFDQQSEEHRVADWGGDDLFTRMPRPRAVDDAPPPRFRPQQLEEPAAPRALALVESPEERRTESGGEEWDGPQDRRRDGRTAEEAMQERAERLGLSVIDGDAEPDSEPTVRHPDDGWDRTGQ